MTVIRSETWGFILGISKGAFSAGASFEVKDEKSYASGTIRNKPEDLKDNCGYWASFPYMITQVADTSQREDQHDEGL